jgi:hypothetical protein
VAPSSMLGLSWSENPYVLLMALIVRRLSYGLGSLLSGLCIFARHCWPRPTRYVLDTHLGPVGRCAVSLIVGDGIVLTYQYLNLLAHGRGGAGSVPPLPSFNKG